MTKRKTAFLTFLDYEIQGQIDQSVVLQSRTISALRGTERESTPGIMSHARTKIYLQSPLISGIETEDL